MIIPVSDLIKYEGRDWTEYLKGIELYDMFEGVCKKYKYPTITSVMRYIIWTYSLDSDKIILGHEWVSNKKKIFAAAHVPAELEADVLQLKCEAINTSVSLWLDFQNSDAFSQWAMLNDLIMEMKIAANSPIKKSITKENKDGQIDYEQKIKCAESVMELMVKKAEVEEKFLQNNPKLKKAYQDISKYNIKQKGNSFGLETMLKAAI